jgi:hypothetical protein
MRGRLALVAVLLACAGCSSSTATSPTTTSAPVTETFASLLAAGGASSRTFTLTFRGPVSATLTSVDPPVAVGVGIGIAGGTPSCSLTKSAVLAPGSTLMLSDMADPGSYCAEIYDPGTVTNHVSFSMTIQHPD